MLSAKIKHRDTEKTYQEELVGFSWSTSNNEGASFVASVPNLTASLKIAEVDDFISMLGRGDTVDVMSDYSNALTLKLSIIEVVPFGDQGQVEISCTGNFFTESNSIFGTLSIPANTWANTQRDFGLENVELHDASNNGLTLNVDKKEDIIMGLAWGFDTRRNVARTPFTSGDGYFGSDGVGIFKNVKPTDTVDTYAPVYKVTADQVIDYAVSPAQPPVTHIQTTTIGKYAPTPQIQPIQFNASTPQVLVSSFRSFYIQELGIGAVSVIQRNSADVVTGQTLTWTDGFVNDWTLSTAKNIVGIFSNAYVVADSSDNKLKIYNRETDALIVASTAISDIASIIHDDVMTASMGPVTGYTGTVKHEILWFYKASSTGAFALVYWPTTSNCTVLTNASLNAGYYFAAYAKKGASSRAKAAALFYNDNDTSVCLLATVDATAVGTASVTVEAAYLRHPDVSISLVPYSWEYMYPIDIMFDGGNKLIVAITGAVTKAAWMPGETRNYIPCTAILRSDYGSPQSGYVYTCSSVATLTYAYGGKWVDGNAINAAYATTPFLYHTAEVYGPVILWLGVPYVNWRLAQDARTSGWTELMSIPVLQVGSVVDWLGYTGNYYIGLMKESALILYDRGAGYYEVAMQISDVPYMSRMRGASAIMLKIAEGSTNPAVLAFKVGPLAQSDRYTWDYELGRIEVDLAYFHVRKNSDSTWLEKNVQALNVMAVGSYVLVQLTPDVQAADMLLVKVTGFTLSYEGKVTAKMTGIVVG